MIEQGYANAIGGGGQTQNGTAGENGLYEQKTLQRVQLNLLTGSIESKAWMGNLCAGTVCFVGELEWLGEGLLVYELRALYIDKFWIGTNEKGNRTC